MMIPKPQTCWGIRATNDVVSAALVQVLAETAAQALQIADAEAIVPDPGDGLWMQRVESKIHVFPDIALLWVVAQYEFKAGTHTRAYVTAADEAEALSRARAVRSWPEGNSVQISRIGKVHGSQILCDEGMEVR